MHLGVHVAHLLNREAMHLGVHVAHLLNRDGSVVPFE